METAYCLIYPGCIPEALSQAPKITINSQAWSDESYGRLLSREADFGIAILEHDERAGSYVHSIPEELNHLKLIEDYTVCLMRPDHPALQEVWDLDAFMKYRHIQVVTGGIETWAFHEVLASHHLKLNKAVNVSDVVSAVRLCKQTDLLMCYASAPAQDYIYSGELIARPLPITLAPGALFLLWHKHLDSDPGHRWLREVIARPYLK